MERYVSAAEAVSLVRSGDRVFIHTAAAAPDIAAGLAHLDAGRVEPALTSLLDAVKATAGDERDLVRAVMVGVFADLGDTHPTTIRFRKRLAQSLY